MTEPQPKATPPTVEQRLSEIANKSSITLRELKELVFQYQRAENKSCKEENEKAHEEQREVAQVIQGTKLRNEAMKLDLEYAELKPKWDLLQDSERPKKKKFLFF